MDDICELILEHIGVSIIITDAKGTILYVNPAFEESSGYLAHEVLGRNPRIFKSGIHPDGFYSTMWTTLLAGHAWRGLMCNKHKSGSLFFEQVLIVPVSHPDNKLFFAIKQDVSSFQEYQAKLQYLVENVDIGYVEFSYEGLIINFNPAAEAIFGWYKHEILGSRGALLVPDYLRGEIFKKFDEYREGQAGSLVLKNLTKAGEIIVCEWIITPLYAEGNLIALACFVKDITTSFQEREFLSDVIEVLKNTAL